MSEKKKTDVQKLFGGNKAGFEQLMRESDQQEDMALGVVKSMRGLFAMAGEDMEDFDKEMKQLEKESQQRKEGRQKLVDSLDED